MAGKTTNANGEVTAHVKRVTLNLIRHSATCPPELRRYLDQLADNSWKLKTLAPAVLEHIYAEVDDDLAYRARSEFQADLETVVDHKYSSSHFDCKLCGHNPIRFEFLLRNHRGGQDVWTGSTCIEEYGINVLGAETAEAALAALRRVLAAKRREYQKFEWTGYYPFAGIAIDRLNDDLNQLAEPITADVYAGLPAGWFDAVERWVKSTEGLLRLYKKHGYLPGLQFGRHTRAQRRRLGSRDPSTGAPLNPPVVKGRTAELFGSPSKESLSAQAATLIAQREAARDAARDR